MPSPIRMICTSIIGIRMSTSIARDIFRSNVPRKKTTGSYKSRTGTVEETYTIENSSQAEKSRKKISKAVALSSQVKKDVELNFLGASEEHESLVRLKSLLKINEKQVMHIIKKYPQFKSTQIDSVSATLNYLTNNKVSLNRILSNPWILLIQPEILEPNFKKVMKILNIESFDVALSFVNLKLSKLQEMGSLWKRETKEEPALLDNNIKSRLEFLAFTLECPTSEAGDMISKVDGLKTMPFSTMERILTTLLDGGVQKVNIRTDPWIFEHNVNRMIERLNISQIRGLPVIKPWILRSPTKKFEDHCRRMIQEQNLLKGHENVASFLQQKLSCDKSTINEVLLRVPSIKTASAMKLNEMIQFLFSQGFTADHILETPRILGHSVETIASRVKQLSTYNLQPYSILVLCKTSKHYLTFIRRLSKERCHFIKNKKAAITDSLHNKA